jgi:hypothetical protein
MSTRLTLPTILNKPPRCDTQGVAGAFMPLFVSLFSTQTLMQIVIVLATTVAMKALSVHYEFSWVAALIAG